MTFSLVSVSFLLFLLDTSHIGLGPTLIEYDLILTWLHLQRLYSKQNPNHMYWDFRAWTPLYGRSWLILLPFLPSKRLSLTLRRLESRKRDTQISLSSLRLSQPQFWLCGFCCVLIACLHLKTKLPKHRHHVCFLLPTTFLYPCIVPGIEQAFKKYLNKCIDRWMH